MTMEKAIMVGLALLALGGFTDLGGSMGEAIAGRGAAGAMPTLASLAAAAGGEGFDTPVEVAARPPEAPDWIPDDLEWVDDGTTAMGAGNDADGNFVFVEGGWEPGVGESWEMYVAPNVDELADHIERGFVTRSTSVFYGPDGAVESTDIQSADAGNTVSGILLDQSGPVAESATEVEPDKNVVQRQLSNRVVSGYLSLLKAPFSFISEKTGGNTFARVAAGLLMPWSALATGLYSYAHPATAMDEGIGFAESTDVSQTELENEFGFPLDYDDYEGEEPPPVLDLEPGVGAETEAATEAGVATAAPAEVTNEPAEDSREADAANAEVDPPAIDDTAAEAKAEATEEDLPLAGYDPGSSEALFADALRGGRREDARDQFEAIWQNVNADNVEAQSKALVDALVKHPHGYQSGSDLSIWLQEGILLGYDTRLAISLYEEAHRLEQSREIVSDEQMLSLYALQKDLRAVPWLLSNGEKVEDALRVLAECDNACTDEYAARVHETVSTVGAPRLAGRSEFHVGALSRGILDAINGSENLARDPGLADTRAMLADFVEAHPYE